MHKSALILHISQLGEVNSLMALTDGSFFGWRGGLGDPPFEQKSLCFHMTPPPQIPPSHPTS